MGRSASLFRRSFVIFILSFVLWLYFVLYVYSDHYDIRVLLTSDHKISKFIYGAQDRNEICYNFCNEERLISESTSNQEVARKVDSLHQFKKFDHCECSLFDRGGLSLPSNSTYRLSTASHTSYFECYDHIRTLPVSQSLNQVVIFHTYWRADLAPFGRKQLAVIRSFLATQNPNLTLLKLWTNDPKRLLRESPELLNLHLKYENRTEIEFANFQKLAEATPVENAQVLLNGKDNQAYSDSDLIRYLALYKFGGVWIDMDVMLIRDLSSILHQEFIHEWLSLFLLI